MKSKPNPTPNPNPNVLHLEITTPEETVFQGDAVSVSLPTPDGEITVLDRHLPLITIVIPGTAVVRSADAEQLFAVTRGLAEIDGQNVRLLVQSADRAEMLEEEAVRQAKERAETLMKERRDDEEGFAEATAIFDREFARLQVTRRRRARKMPRNPIHPEP